MKRLTSAFLLFLLLAVVTVQCTPGPSPSPELATLTTPKAPAIQLSPTPLPTPTAPPTPVPTVTPSCPEPNIGTQLLRNEEMGYCFLFPDGYNRVDPLPYEVCIVPEGPAMACHSAAAFFEVGDAAGRSTSQAADALVAEFSNPDIERATTIIAGEEAVVLDNVPGQATSRKVLIVHTGRLYTLTFIVPSDENGNPDFKRMESLYTEVIGSFEFLNNG